MKKIVSRILPFKARKFLSNIKRSFDFYFTPSYSQEGEDMVLKAIFHQGKKGFYVDIGAHHPQIFSNTLYFYRRGWNGINVDAMPGSMEGFKKLRRRDINLETAISDKQETLTYFAFNEPALNTFSKELAEERMQIPKFKLLYEKQLKTERLSEVLDMHLPRGQHIDFMTIDVEGLDLNVLQSNDWNKYRPTFILIESLEFSFDRIQDSPVASFLYEKEYTLFSKTVNTLFFAEKGFKYNTY
jgi:FkbM family methyltransferase